MKYLKKYIEYIKESIINNDTFKRWFGNSKISINGEPVVVYHGSKNWGILAFDKAYIGETDEGYYGIGFYFTDDLDYAKEYGENIVSCYLRCLNPFRIISVNNDADEKWFDLRDQLADLKGMDLPYLKTIRTLPEGFYVKKEYDDNYRGHGPYTWYAVYPPEKYYGTDNEVYGTETYSELAAIVAYNDMKNDVNYDLGWTPALTRKIGRQKFTDLIKDNGYDCILADDGFGEICVFEPTQIKSIKNDGSWDLNDVNIQS